MIKQLEPNQEELDQLMEIWLNANLEAHAFVGKEYWLAKEEHVRELLPQATLYVAFSNQRIVGFIGMTDVYIAGLFVEYAFQKQGIGKALLAYVKQLSDELTVNVYKENEQAVRFYLKNGFRITEEANEAETGAIEYTMVWSREREG
ncbi:GNAT family N-acetyltransferase [Gracilibacillus massiliensis]|uniref:GNAT family N-acetyltransferase n=1 Tax=Gracilibacillus massiliensis TaxID=1564956 RepID=UPI00071D521F|nr:GNAT family N-acetyltransferase [Gracilibacillus massiliensis]